MAKNANLSKAKNAKNDEFYTRLYDIEQELKNYKQHFEGKTIYCNCDQAFELKDGKMQWHSNFARFFALKFEVLKLKKLICTAFNADGKGQIFIYNGDKNGNRMPDPEEFEIVTLNGNGDFRSEECIAYLKEADIVVTNPPFSLFREFVAQLMEYNKKFLIIGNSNAITYKEIFPYIKDNKLWLGCINPKAYITTLTEVENPKNQYIENGVVYQKFGNHCWFTNLEHSKRNLPLDLYKTYNPIDYPKYDNYDAINVDKTADIPMDYDGVMGVPISFLDKYCPSQFEIVGLLQSSTDEQAGIPNERYYNDFLEMRQDMTYTGCKGGKANGNPVLKGKSNKGNFLFNKSTNEYVHSVYARIVIRFKK